MAKQILCKDCKYLIWYTWWWPYMGVEIEEKQECDHPKNHDTFRDAITGEDWVDDDDFKNSPHKINANRNCKWFEEGKHRQNLGGKMSKNDRDALNVHQQREIAQFEYMNRPWWKFW